EDFLPNIIVQALDPVSHALHAELLYGREDGERNPVAVREVAQGLLVQDTGDDGGCLAFKALHEILVGVFFARLVLEVVEPRLRTDVPDPGSEGPPRQLVEDD